MFQSLAALVTVWKSVMWFVAALFLSRALPNNVRQWIPLFAQPVFHSRFREQLQLIRSIENNDAIMNMTEDYLHKKVPEKIQTPHATGILCPTIRYDHDKPD